MTPGGRFVYVLFVFILFLLILITFMSGTHISEGTIYKDMTGTGAMTITGMDTQEETIQETNDPQRRD